MFKNSLIITFTLLLLTPAISAVEVDVRPGECQNNGIILQISPNSSSVKCHGGCQNNGVVLQASPQSSYQCENCENNGIHLFGSGGPCQDGSLPGACMETICTPNCDHHCSMQANEKNSKNYSQSQLPETCKLEVETQEIHCGKAEECSIIQNTGCWTMRFSCGLAFNFTQIEGPLNTVGVYCATWNSMVQEELS